MTRKINYTTIPTDFVRFFLMDGNGNNITGSNNATVTNATWTTSSFSYIKQQLSWGASTTFTYSSFTYTNSYLIKNGNVIKNSGEVGATALSGVNGNTYQGLIFFNRTLTAGEELAITQYAKRKLGPTNTILSGDFPLYSLPNLEQGKVLEISKPKVGSNYINQVDGSSLPITGTISDTINGKYNQINLTGSQYINCGDIIDETKGTIILTYKPTRIYNYNSIFDNAYDSNFWEMWIDSGANLKVRTSAGVTPYTDNSITKTGIVVNKIYRIAYTWNTSLNQTKLYIDGVLIGTNNHQTPPATTFYFGGGNAGNTKGEGGLLYGVLYNKTLSDTEILQDYYAHKIV